MKRIIATAGTGALLLSGLLALPTVAAAKPHTSVVYTYTATIDCGEGPVTVLSTDDMYAPLFDPATRRSYQPVAWNVVYDGQTIQDVRAGKLPNPKRLADCSYDDGGAVGTVTVIAPRGHAR